MSSILLSEIWIISQGHRGILWKGSIPFKNFDIWFQIYKAVQIKDDIFFLPSRWRKILIAVNPIIIWILKALCPGLKKLATYTTFFKSSESASFYLLFNHSEVHRILNCMNFYHVIYNSSMLIPTEILLLCLSVFMSFCNRILERKRCSRGSAPGRSTNQTWQAFISSIEMSAEMATS